MIKKLLLIPLLFLCFFFSVEEALAYPPSTACVGGGCQQLNATLSNVVYDPVTHHLSFDLSTGVDLTTNHIIFFHSSGTSGESGDRMGEYNDSLNWNQTHVDLDLSSSGNSYSGGTYDMTSFTDNVYIALLNNEGSAIAYYTNRFTIGSSSTPATVKVVSSPSSGDVTVGVPFTVNVAIEDGGDPFNAVRANVSVSSNLSITGLDTNPSTNACNLHYVQTPTTDNLSFAGAIFGGSATDCTAYRLTLTPVSAGTGTITFTNASIKAYDDASEILTGVQNASFTINENLVTLPELTVTSPIQTYLSSFHLFGTKDAAVNHVFVNDSETGSTYPSSTTWDSAVTLALGANTFTLHGEDNDGNQTPELETTVTRHILGDINGDSVVNLTDASLFAVDWDKTENLTYILSDMNNDGLVNLTDLSILAKHIQ